MTARAPDQPLIPPRIGPLDANRRLVISNEPVEFVHSGTKRIDNARVELTLAPKAELSFSWDAPKDFFDVFRMFNDGNCDQKLVFPNRGVEVDAILIESGERITCIPSSGLVEANQQRSDLRYAIGHLFNFPDFHGAGAYSIDRPVGTSHRSTRCSTLVLSDSGWTITLASLENTREAFRSLRSSGGFALTHMLRLERSDHCDFSSEQARHLLDAVHAFLSLAIGQWCGLGCITGHAANDATIWELWGMYRAAAREPNGGLSWFDHHHADCLEQTWPGFFSLWNHSLWRETEILQRSINWYLTANSQGGDVSMESRLVFAQVALEHISWIHCVRDKRMVSARAFGRGGLSAADKFRLLASSMAIPIDIPPALRVLAHRPGKPWEDVMEVITSMRNSVVHPTGKENFGIDSYIDGWRASMWILDLVFLRLMQHRGGYRSRINAKWVGEIAQVPWADT